MRKDRITVRIWYSQSEKKVGNISAGHVSLETHSGTVEKEGIYASLWPPLKNDHEYSQSPYLIAELPGARLRTYAYDKIQFERPEDEKIEIFGLDLVPLP